MAKRSNRSLSTDLGDTKAELDDILAAPSVRPSLEFLGLGQTRAPAQAPANEPNIASGARVLDGQSRVVPNGVKLIPAISNGHGANVDALVNPVPSESPPRVPAAPPARTPGRPVSSFGADDSVPTLSSVSQRTANTATSQEHLDPVGGSLTPYDEDAGSEEKGAPQGRKKIVRKCVRAQDGHSHIEQEVYATLWRYGKEDPNNVDSRLSNVGHTLIARESRVHERNVTLIVNRLIQKLAIEVAKHEVSDKRIARTYRVFSYAEILRRRKLARLDWVVRGRGIEFVDPATGEPLFPTPDRNKRAVTASAALATPDGVTASDLDHITARVGDGFTSGEPSALSPSPTPGVRPSLRGINNKESFKEENSRSTIEATSTSLFPCFDLVAKAMGQVAYADHNAVVQLVEDCSAIVPDVTAEEICEFIEEKSNIVAGSSTIKNPIGFLLATVPKCLVGESFLEHRKQKRLHAEKLRLETEAEAERLETVAKQAVALITEASSPEELKLRIRSEFIADPYRPLASYLSEDEKAEAGRVWSAVRDRLQTLLDVQAFQTWFRPLKGFRYNEGTLKVVVPVREFMHLDGRYPDQLNQAVERVRHEVEGLAGLKRLQFFDGSDFRV
jgi:hypothetical protein